MGTVIPFHKPDPQSFRELLQDRVPVHVRRLLAQGGPQEHDWEAAHSFTGILGPRGDDMQFIFEPGTKKQKEIAARRDEMAQHIAALAFLPNGIRAFGLHFQVIDGTLSIDHKDGPAGEFHNLHTRKSSGSYY